MIFHQVTPWRPQRDPLAICSCLGVFRLSSASPPLEGPPSPHTRREYRKLAWGGTPPPPTAVSIKRDNVSADAHPPLIQFHSTTGGSRNPSNPRTGSKPLLLETKGRDAQVGAGGGRTLSTRKGTPCHCFNFQGTRTFLTRTTESTAPCI